MRPKTNNDLGCSAFTFSMQPNLEFAIQFWVLRFSDSCLQKERKRLSIPEPIHFYVFFLKPICKKTQSNPELINHFALPIQTHFLKINPNVLQWLGALQPSNSFRCAWENLSEKVFVWSFFDGKNDWSNIWWGGWWFGTCFMIFHILGISSSQLTFIFFRRGWNPQPVYILVSIYIYISDC